MGTVRIRKASAANGDGIVELSEGLRRQLQELGMHPYSARLLVALLQAGSGNSAVLAELSGVPRTSIYRVMDALTE